jgi:hypothetical protein
VKEEIDKFKGNTVSLRACMKALGLVGTKVCPIGYVNDLYESVKEADKVLTF